MDRRSENKAIGMLAPAKLEKPINQTTCGKTGRRVSIQPGAMLAEPNRENKHRGG